MIITIIASLNKKGIPILVQENHIVEAVQLLDCNPRWKNLHPKIKWQALC